MTQRNSVNKVPEEADTEMHSPDNNDDALELIEVENKTSQDNKEKSTEKLLIIEEITELLSNDDLAGAVSKFKTDSEDKEIAVEFANSHILFLEQLVDSDNRKGISRSDVEIRDLVSHVNVMLKNKDEYLFTTIVINSPAHYKIISKKLLKKK